MPNNSFELIGSNSGEESGEGLDRQTARQYGDKTLQANKNAEARAKLEQEYEHEKELAKLHEAFQNEKDPIKALKMATELAEVDPTFRAFLENDQEADTATSTSDSDQNPNQNPNQAPGQALDQSSSPNSDTGNRTRDLNIDIVIDPTLTSNPDTDQSSDQSQDQGVGPDGNKTTSDSKSSDPNGSGQPDDHPGDHPDDQPDDSANPNQQPGSSEIPPDKLKKNTALKVAIATAAAAALAGVIFFGTHVGRKQTSQPPVNGRAPVESETEMDNGDFDDITVEDQETQKGIKDGYGEKGMWLSENKTSKNAFASASEVAEVCNNNEREMVKYTARNQVESFADYLANLPQQLQPDEFKGLSIIDTEHKLESLSDDDYDGVVKYFNNLIDNSLKRNVILNGPCENAYMRKNGDSAETTHDNMELVKWRTNENNLEATQLYWVDGKTGQEIGSITFKIVPIRDEQGNIIGFTGCNQAVNVEGSASYLYIDMDEDNEEETGTGTVTHTSETSKETETETEKKKHHNTEETTSESNQTKNTPSETQPDPVPQPAPEPAPEPAPAPVPDIPVPQPETPETHPPKNEEAERANAGDVVTPLDVDPNAANSEEEHESQEAFNQILVDQVSQEDLNNATVAAEVAENQSAAEQAAAEVAADNRAAEQAAYDNMSPAEQAQENAAQAVADVAQENNESAAATVQQEANAPVQEQVAEQAAAEQAQAAADANAAAAAETVEPVYDAGDFTDMAGEMGL